jgi:histidine ammonia-lyase
MSKNQIIIDSDIDLSIEDIEEAAYFNVSVVLSKKTQEMLDRRRKQVIDYIKREKVPAYGFNRGFGHNVDLSVSPEKLNELQENLIKSHSVGVGDPAPREIVRTAMLLRAKSLAKGHSGVRSIVVQHIVDMLNNDIVPYVPKLGSVGASGDLAPMSHIALAMMGEGLVWYQGKKLKARDALKKSGLSPLKLEMKEGLALNNGVQFMTAIGIHATIKMDILLKTASITAALSTQVMLGADTSFREDLHELRKHPGGIKVAKWIFELMKESPIRNAHRRYDIDGEIQDPYNIRCAAQILGTCAELIDECRKTLLIEANSVTDNPVILKATINSGLSDGTKNNYEDKYVEIVSGGHFHGMPIAVRIYNLFQAMGMMASLSNLRCARYVDKDRNKGLGSDLKWIGLSEEDLAVSSGMMIPEYSSAALTSVHP